MAAIDGGATVNGAAFATENTDADDNDFRLAYVPPQDHAPGSLRAVYHIEDSYPRWVGYGRSPIYHPVDGQIPSTPIGHIPQVPHTYGLYESGNALMNDQGLGIGESSCGAMLLNKLAGMGDNRSVPEALLDSMTLMQLVLERCGTARCAVEEMGRLVEEFGYLPDGGKEMLAAAAAGKPPAGMIDGRRVYEDVGEAYAFSDATGEAWVMNVIGGVNGVLRSVWTAQKVPKGHAAFVANTFTIGDLPEKPNDEFRFPREIFRAAIVAGLWDGKGKLHWSNVFAPDPTKLVSGGDPPIPVYSSLRQWRMLNLAAPSLGTKFEFDSRKLPFSVKVEQHLTHRDIFEWMSDHYGGTEFDMTQGVLAGPYQTPFRVEGGPSWGDAPRGISILRTSYAIVAESGPAGSVAWYAMDTPATSVFVPFDVSSGGAVAPSFQRGHNQKFDRSSAWWAFDFVNNWMQLNYKGMSEEDVLPARKAWQDRIDKERAARASNPRGAEDLGQWQLRLQEELVASWWSLSEAIIAKWNDMRRQISGPTSIVPTGGTAYGYPEWWAEMIGFNHDPHPIWVKRAVTPPTDISIAPSTVTVPGTWSITTGWVSDSAEALLEAVAVRETASNGTMLMTAASGLLLFSLGFFLGQRRNARIKVESLLG